MNLKQLHELSGQILNDNPDLANAEIKLDQNIENAIGFAEACFDNTVLIIDEYSVFCKDDAKKYIIDET